MVEFKNINKEEVPFDLLYLADSDEDQINKYFHESEFIAALIEDKIVGMVGLKELNKKSIEIVCLAVYEQWQNQKIGRQLVENAISFSKNEAYEEVIIKTGNCGLMQLKLYMKCGFRLEKIIPDYFLEHYKFPIYEEGIQCVDQVQLKYKIYAEKEIDEKIKAYWNKFIELFPEYKNSTYEVWSFGYGDYMANELIGYVRQGIKTGTSSAYEMYTETEKKPEEHDLSIVTYGNGLPGCIIKTIEIRNKLFDEINEEEARFEGEGDLSLAYWRAVHEEFFRKEYNEKGKEFTWKIPVIYEKFEVIFDDDVKQ
ncbi:MAG: GNAT family N-acetyltransferase [Anaerolineaceae bacterium]|nr:GNAT family N-acetyltransferase [Anaerolineaceae bacterium]